MTVTELLGDAVYDPSKHLREAETSTSRGETKKRLERYIEVKLPGEDNARAKSLARSIIAYAQEVKHATTPSRREAGIAADSVIILTNLLRRLDQEI